LLLFYAETKKNEGKELPKEPKKTKKREKRKKQKGGDR
jgi:hypothetical protein